ncbi:MAG: hypothetical protein ACOC7M_01570 [Chloroflexota bacterium]
MPKQTDEAMQGWPCGVLASYSEEERRMLEVLLSRMAEGAGDMVGRSPDMFDTPGC